MILIFLSPFNSISFLLVVFWGFLILPMFPIPLRLGFLPNRYANKGQLFVSQCLTCFWLPAHWMQNLRIALQGVKCFSFLIQTSPEGTRRLPLFVYALSLSRFDVYYHLYLFKYGEYVIKVILFPLILYIRNQPFP